MVTTATDPSGPGAPACVEPDRSTDPAQEPRWRVAELARRADESVDTIRFYQKLRLLPSPQRVGRVAYYGEHHVERLERIRMLQSQGFTLALIGRIVAGHLDRVDAPLAAAVASTDEQEHLIGAEELADLAGVPPALVELAVSEGLLIPRESRGQEGFSTADVDLVRAGLDLLEQGLPLDALLDLARRHHLATLAIAEAAVSMFDEHIRRPLREADLDDDERAQRLVSSFQALFPAVSALVDNHFRRVLLNVAQEHLSSVGEPAEIAAAATSAGRSDGDDE